MNEEVVEGSKAIQETAKATGKAIDVGNKFGQFIGKFISGSLEQSAGMIEDKLKYIRWENRINFMIKGEKFLKLKGLDVPNKTIPIKLAAPLFQAASFEDDDYLQDMWAKLLVNSTTEASNFELKRMYIDIMEQLSTFDAIILEKIYTISYEKALHKHIITTQLPEVVELPEKQPSNYPDPTNDVKLALLNLDRLNCIAISVSIGGSQIFGMVNQTLLGKKFIDACTI